MKIAAIETVVVNAVFRNWIFVKVLTDQPGLHGWGKATVEWKTRVVVGAIEDLTPLILGEDPLRIEHVVRRMTQLSFWPLGTVGLSAASGIEQALWDIKGKALGVPVWQLLGDRVRDRVRVYTHLYCGDAQRRAPQDVEPFCEAVAETLALGYDAIKLGVVSYTGHAAPLPSVCSVERLALRLRETVGEGVDLMFDSHGRPDSVEAARAYVDALAPIRPLSVEEPIQPGYPAALADLARRVDCPLTTGERLFTSPEYAELAALRAVTFVQPDLSHCLGFSGGRRIAAIAEAAQIGICPHNPIGPVAGAVALQFEVATPGFVI
ncbi:enolase C-terminal domain-like protein [Rubellimicrobium roseum]|uniref:enolase C-terminal domain-like protein n=1 Tax=Rubellimicrobium roseum TaxID=687525 RepID=UPI001C3F3869|nr:enolase C-terminal domain-like protein [Rubellimicrobium roseum]